MVQHLVLTVRVHGDALGTGRFHGMSQGAPEWPPAPGRLFQALVAGAARAGRLPDAIQAALTWLERQPPPLVGAPARTLGQRVGLFVPNNDADALADPHDVSEIRTKKVVHPSLYPADMPFLYVWSGPLEADHAQAVASAAASLYQLGRGVDAAWAVGELVEADELDTRLAAYRGVLHRPQLGGRGDVTLACPAMGSLASLIARHGATKITFAEGRREQASFTNPPKPYFLQVGYGRATDRALFHLQAVDTSQAWPWKLERASKLVELARDEAAARLRSALPAADADIERVLVGRKGDGRDAGPIEQRVRIIPLPSIGATHADHAIRRLLVDVPRGGPVSAADLTWAFSGLGPVHPETGEVGPFVLVRDDADAFLDHYTGPSHLWRSVTPVALPETAARRRIDPARQRDDAKNATERRAEEDRAVGALHHALRHAGVRATAVRVHVQREPFDGHGRRAEAFAADTRFAKERLWHMELEFDRPLEGPLVLGDGRFLGLGVLAPTRPAAMRPSEARLAAGYFAFAAIGDDIADEPETIARAMRRAVMARVQALRPREELEAYFTGHGGQHDAAEPGAKHLAFHWHAASRRLLIIAPHLLDHRTPWRNEREHLEQLEAALEGMAELRAGRAGRFGLQRLPADSDDPLIRASRQWRSVTPYLVTRHAKHQTADEALAADVRAQCRLAGLPEPVVRVVSSRGAAGRGLEGMLALEFAVAVEGPVVLGRTRYLGGGGFGVGE